MPAKLEAGAELASGEVAFFDSSSFAPAAIFWLEAKEASGFTFVAFCVWEEKGFGDFDDIGG